MLLTIWIPDRIHCIIDIMENQTNKFSTEIAVQLFVLNKNTPSSRWLDWQPFDFGPGIFLIPEDSFLGIRAQGIDDDALFQLVRELSSVSCLRYLYLAENRKITNKGILNLEKLNQIEYLNISSCDITSEGLEFLPSLTNLKFLDLSYCNRISEKAAQYIQKLPRLQYLDIKGVIKINTSSLKKFEKRGLVIHQY